MADTTYKIIIEAVQKNFGAAKAAIVSAMKGGADESSAALAGLNARLDMLDAAAKTTSATLDRIDAFRKLKTESEELSRKWDEAQARAWALADAVKQNESASAGMSARQKEATAIGAQLKAEWQQAQVQAGELAAAVKLNESASAGMSARQKEAAAIGEKLKAEWQQAQARVKELAVEIRATGGNTSELNSRFEMAKTEARDLKEQWQAAGGMAEGLSRDIKETDAATAALNVKFNAGAQEARDLKEQWQAAEGMAKGLSKDIKDTDAATAGLNKQFSVQVKESKDLKAAYNGSQVELQQMRSGLKAAGVNTKDLASAQVELRGRLKSTEAAVASTKAEFAAAQTPSVGFFTQLKTAGKTFHDEMDSGKSKVSGWSTVLKTAFAYIGIREITSGLFNAGREANNLNIAFESISGSGAGAADELAFVRQVTEDLKMEFYSTADGYKGIFAAAKDTKLAGQGVRDLFTGIAEASVALRMSNDDTNGSLRALHQMLSKGKVQAEELRGQLGERLPGAFQLAADAMGVTTQELDKMLEQGEVLAEEMLPKLAVALHEKYGAAAKAAAADTENAQGSLNVFITAWKDFRKELSDAGFMEAATGTLRKLAETIKDPETVKSIKELVGGFFSMVGSVIQVTLEYGKWIALIGGSIAAVVKITQTVGALNAAFLKVGSSFAIGFPHVAIVAALAAVGYGLYKLITYHREAAEAAAESAAAHRKYVNDLDVLNQRVEAVKDDQAAYLQVLKDFREEFPELASKIQQVSKSVDITVMSFDELKEAMNRVRIEEFKKQIADLGEQIDLLAKDSKWDAWIERFTNGFVLATTGIQLTDDSIKKFSKSLDGQIEVMGKASSELAEWAVQAKLSNEEVFDLIDSMVSQNKISEEYADRLKAWVIPALEEFREREQELADQQKDNSEEVSAASAKAADAKIKEMGRALDELEAALKQEVADIELSEQKKEITRQAAAKREFEAVKKNAAERIEAIRAALDEEEFFTGRAYDQRAAKRAALNKSLDAAELEITQANIKYLKEVEAADKAANTEREKSAESRYEKAIAQLSDETTKTTQEYKIRLAMIAGLEQEGVISHADAINQKSDAELDFVKFKVDQLKKQASEAIKYYGEESTEYLSTLEEMEGAYKELIQKQTEMDQTRYEEKRALLFQERETMAQELELSLKHIEDLENEGVITHAEAVDKKIAAELEFARKKADQTAKTLADAKAAFGEESEQYAEAMDEMAAAQEELAEKEAEVEERREKAAVRFKALWKGYVDMIIEEKRTYEELSEVISEVEDKTANRLFRYGTLGPWDVAYKKLTDIKGNFEAISAAAEKFMALKWDLKNLSLDQAREQLLALREMLSGLYDDMAAGRDRISEMREELADWRGGVDDASAALEYFEEKNLDARAAMEALFDDQPKSIEEIEDAIEAVADEYDSLVSAGEAAIDALKGQWDDLQGKIEETGQKIRDLYADTEETIRGLQRDLMSDEQAWLDIRKEALEKYEAALAEMNAGNFEAAEQLFDAARALAESLAAEVKDESGNVIMTLSQTTEEAIDLIERITASQGEALTDIQDGLIDNQKNVDDALDETFSKLEKNIASASRLKQILDRTPLPTSGKWGEFMDEYLSKHGYESLGSGGWIGGRPHSQGGTIIEAERDEFVQPVPAVKKYGLRFMEMVRTLQFPANFVESIIAGAGFGLDMPAAIAAGVQSMPAMLTSGEVPRYAAGGPVPALAPVSPAAPEKTIRVQFAIPGTRKEYAGDFAEDQANGLIRALAAAKARSI